MKKEDKLEITDSRVIASYEKNITEFSIKNIQSVYRPKTILELQSIVKKANETNSKLFFISTGKNWGLGSKQPVEHNNSVVELRNINSIIEVNERFRYAIIEPGVTQKDLSDYLNEHYPNLKFPVTGSAEQTSIIGNILERGASAFGHRNDKVIAMEILMANGEFLKTGFWHYVVDNNPLSFHYPYGHGPDLRGLFTQSNLGIITKMVIRLQPKSPGVIIVLKFKESELKNITDLLLLQHERNIIEPGLVITNENDPRTTKQNNYRYQGNWIAVASLSGDPKLFSSKKKIVRALKKEVKVDITFISTEKNTFSLKKDSAKVFLLDQIRSSSFLRSRKFVSRKLNSGESLQDHFNKIESLRKYYHGTPLNYSIITMAQMNNTKLVEEELDNSTIMGLSVSLPAVPIEGKSVIEVTQIVNEVSKKWDVLAFHNFASVDELTFEGFYRVYFDRSNQKEIETAHGWSKDLNKQLREKGYFPYRIDNENMTEYVDKNDVFWKTIKNIKLALDMNEIISPKKYNY